LLLLCSVLSFFTFGVFDIAVAVVLFCCCLRWVMLFTWIVLFFDYSS